jgi:DNA-binding MarR family transcriptional regulator
MEDIVRALGLLCLGTRMKRLGERLQSQTQAIVDAVASDISAGQYPLFGAIDRLGPLTIGELAEALGVSQPGTTRTVNQLVVLGYLEIKPSVGDQRRKVVDLSVKGQALVDISKVEVWPKVEHAVTDLCRGLEGPLLEQLAAIEDGLEAESLSSRSRKTKP